MSTPQNRIRPMYVKLALPPSNEFIALTLTLLLTSCNLEKEVEIQLPSHNSVPVVECYLEPGKPFTLLLTRTSSYFTPFPQDELEFLSSILEDSAQVIISTNGIEYELENTLGINPLTSKVFNYYNPTPVPHDAEYEFALSIRLKNGQTIYSQTRLLPPVPIDSIVVQFNADSLARVLTYFTDPDTAGNYYRRMLHLSSIDSLPLQDFVSTDQFLDNNIGIFGTTYQFEVGDTLINTLFHIEKAYADFLQSIEEATHANGNPFSQPSTIISNLQGDARAIGIFTGLSYDRVITIISP